MAKIPNNSLISQSPISQKELDERVSKLISDETKKKANEAEAIIAKSGKAREALVEIVSEIEKSNREIESLTNQKNGLQGEITLSLDKIAELNNELAALSKEKDEARDTVRIVKDELKDMDSQAEVAATRMDIINGHLKTANEAVDSKVKDMSELDKSIGLKKEEIERLDDTFAVRAREHNDKLSELSGKVALLEREVLAVKGKCATALDEFKVLADRKEDLLKEISDLKEQKFQLSIDSEDYKSQLEANFKKKYSELDVLRGTVNEREINTKLMSDGLADRKTHLDAYKLKLLKLVGALMIDTGINDQTKAVLKDIESKL